MHYITITSSFKTCYTSSTKLVKSAIVMTVLPSYSIYIYIYIYSEQFMSATNLDKLGL